MAQLMVGPGTALALLCLRLCAVQAVNSDKTQPTRNVVITAEEEKLRDPEGFAAIKELHRLMDDDQSGSIDRFESADFLTEDLKVAGSDRSKRERAFHHNNDDSITVDDLWESWFQSDERMWTNEELVDWLTHAVKLPQYAANVVAAKSSGIALPRMAVQNSSYVSNVLGVRSFVHRQKIQLKALDVVLFGFHDKSSRLKDIALAALAIGLVSVLILFKAHRNRSRRKMEELASRLSELATMETDFAGAQKRFEAEQRDRQDLTESEHIQALKNQLMEAERRLEMNGYDSIPFALQPLLRRTYEMEAAYINTQKLECLSEMREAKEFVDKMRRKQSSVLNSLKLATGASSGTDAVDSKVFALKTRMERIKLTMDECQQRWMDIETLCGFSITGPFGVPSPPNGALPQRGSSNSLANGMRHHNTTAWQSEPTRVSDIHPVQRKDTPTSNKAFSDAGAHHSTASAPVAGNTQSEPMTQTPPMKFTLHDDESVSLSSSNGQSTSSKKSKLSDLLKRKFNNFKSNHH
ncbi:Protein STIM-1 c [Aphelenchoides avenae]|nr:Protein STIM-1 c [Aphelenchus avenae]